MADYARMQKVVMGTLAVMMVASLLLAVVAIATPRPVVAQTTLEGRSPQPLSCCYYENRCIQDAGCGVGWGMWKHCCCWSVCWPLYRMYCNCPSS